MKKKWQLRGVASIDAPPMAMPQVVWKILSSRGYKTKEEIQNFLAPSLKDLTDPLKLHDMDKAIDRLKLAFENNEPICVYGDYDLDGSSGIALLVRGLEGLGFDRVSFYQPSRFLEGYGINSEALKTISDRGDKVVISVDCGITAIEEAQTAKSLGLDLIITDHHLPRETLPECVAVVNPNKGFCESGLGHISGVGVGFYLIMALKRALGVEFDLKSLLDFFTIGTITDMVPLIKENRVLLKHGLKVLSQTRRAGLKALCENLEIYGRELEASDVSFTLGPKLNALSRLEKGLRPLDILMCEDEKVAPVLAEQVLKLNDERKEIQKELQGKILEQLTFEEMQNPAIVLAAHGHAGVVGLVATKISQQTLKPTFIVAISDNEAVGSARGLEADMLPTALDAAKDFLDRYGGHAQAAGFSLSAQNFEKFKAKVLEHYSNHPRETDLAVEELYDADADYEEIDVTVMKWFAQMGPFGQTNPLPLIRIPIKDAKITWLKNLHLKIQLGVGVKQVGVMGFFAKDNIQWMEHLKGDVELLIEPSWNYWKGRKSLQFLIRDIQNLNQNKACFNAMGHDNLMPNI